MATDAQVIAQVRRIVSDFTEPQRYGKEFYADAIAFALQKLSFDFGVDYFDIPSVPYSRVFLLVKLAAIQLCYIRAASGAEKEDGEAVEGTITTIAVPDLSVSEASEASDESGPAFWMKLARELQDEYDGEVGDNKAGQNQGGTVEQGYTHRISLTTGGYRKRKLDPGLPATAVGVMISGNDVLVSWSKVFREDFSSYDVYRSASVTFSAEQRVALITDNHVTEFVEEGVPSGQWYYRVKTVNPNNIKTNSNTVSALVP